MPGSAGPQSQAGFLWVAESGGILNIRTDDETIAFEIPHPQGVSGLAVNDLNGELWAYRKKWLYRYTRDGQQTLQIEALLRGGPPVDLVVDGVAGNLWLGGEKNLYRFDLQGQLRQTLRLPSKLQALSLDRSRSQLWAAFEQELRIYDRDASQVLAVPLGKPSNKDNDDDDDSEDDDEDRGKYLAYDPQLDAVWVAQSERLRRYDPAGRLSFEAAGDFRGQITADGARGLWLAHNRVLRHISETGTENLRLTPFSDQPPKNIVDFIADPGDASVWVASSRRLRHYAADGALLGEIIPSLSDGVIRKLRRTALYADVDAPEIQITTPTPGALLNSRRPRIELSYFDLGVGVNLASIKLTVNDQPLAASCQTDAGSAQCLPDTALPEGELLLKATIADLIHNVSAPAEVRFTVDTLPPRIAVTHPADGLITNQPQQAITGDLNEPAALTISGNAVPLNSMLAFSYPITLQEGGNGFTLSATDPAGNQSTVTRDVILDTAPPAIPAAGLITLSEPQDGRVTVTGQAGSVEPRTRVTVANARTGQNVTVTADDNGAFIATIEATAGDVIRIVASDAANNASEATEAAVATGLPPDPATVAPPLSQTGITPFHEATAFLYSGANPIQTGVAQGTITPVRAAVVRGQVLGRDNTPVTGVTITVKDHPEFGQTLSRADGVFDLAVNGGGVLTFSYEKDGYMPVHRQTNVPWRDFAMLDDVVMARWDTQVTEINLASAEPIQVARGSPVTDADGTRQATLMFTQGTTAQMVMPDGSMQSLSSLSVRATEYTVGANGPKTMPAPLPPASGYTYAVELSADEAITAGAKSVQFSKPVWFYVENFIGFPVGMAVPTGWYDRDKAAWIPSKNGRVVKVLDIQEGKAVLAMTRSGQAATPEELTSLGITDAELGRIAQTYTSGRTLWRVPITHFTPWDCNWPVGPPADAKPPQQPPPKADDKEDKPDCESGSVIECQNQVLGQTIPITGTNFTLNYRSDRVPGRKAAYISDIRLSGTTVPASLKRIDLDIEIAGRRQHFEFPPLPNQRHRLVWDGKDGFGRTINGVQAVVHIGYVYGGVYWGPAAFQNSFSRFGTAPITGSRSREEITIGQKTTIRLGAPLVASQALGGWSLSQHHQYDPSSQTLYEGTGKTRGAQAISNSVVTRIPFLFSAPQRAVAVAPDGSVYFAVYRGPSAVWRRLPDGTLSPVTGVRGGFSGDGGPASKAGVSAPYDLDIAPDGSIYIADTSNFRIRRIGPDGIITTVAGIGVSAFSGDGGPATQASFEIALGIAVAPDGSLYVAEPTRVRRVDPDGIITTVAGDGQFASRGDGGPAIQASLRFAFDVEVANDGSLYIAEAGSGSIRRVGTDGIITRIAGRGFQSEGGDGGPATQAGMVNPQRIAVGPDGTLFIADYSQELIRQVSPDGIMSTAAGVGFGNVGDFRDGAPATLYPIETPTGVDVAPDGSLWIASDGFSPYRVSSIFPEFRLGDTAIPSEDGNNFYRFDSTGRHLGTFDTRSGALVYAFAYDNGGRLISVSNGDGNRTQIERDSLGNAVAVIGMYGQRTQLTLDLNGNLASVTNPLGERHSLVTTSDGLVTNYIDSEGHVSRSTYDAHGQLIKDENASGGSWTLVRTERDRGYTASLTSAEGRTTTYDVEHLTTGDDRRVNTAPDGTVRMQVSKPSGEETNTAPDGTLTAIVQGPDPRFGMQSPVPKVTVRTPDNLTSTTTKVRSATLTNPQNPLSLSALSETTAVNGRNFVNAYVSSTKTWTFKSPLNRQSVMTLDVIGRPATSKSASFETTSYAYTPQGRLDLLTTGSGASARTTDPEYYASGPSAGFLQSITDAEGRSVSYDYDLAGRVTKQTLPGGRFIQYGYDANGNLTSLKPPGREAHIFNYTAVDLEQDYTPPDLGAGINLTRYQYNRDQDLELITRPDGQTIDFQYNAAGKKLSALVIPTGTYGYSYKPATGQLDALTAPGGQSLAYTYDGFLLKSETESGEVPGTVAFTYDNNFWVTQQSVNGSAISFGYDNDGLLTTAGSLALTRNTSHGLITATSLGSVSTSHGYSSFGELAGEEAKVSGSAVYSASYPVRDKLGRIVQRTETIGGVTTSFDYTYDLAGRLDTVKQNGVLVSDYSYDANGNRTSHNATVGTYDGQDRLLTYGPHSYSYTANGELLTKTEGGATTTYGYDVLGNLRTVLLPGDISIEYVIDGRNRRVGKKINGTLVQGFLYGNQLEPIAELDGNNNVVARFIYSSKAHSPDQMVKGGVTYRIISDHLGSPRLVINSSTGEVVQRMDFDEFGTVILDTNPGAQPFGFAGGLYDQHTKLTRFGARDYDAETGRWTARDPIGFKGGDPNLYAYALNNPINLIDPLGLESSTVTLNHSCICPPQNDNNNECATENDAGDPRDYARVGAAVAGVVAGSATVAVDIAHATRHALTLATLLEVLHAPMTGVVAGGVGAVGGAAIGLGIYGLTQLPPPPSFCACE